ncbi:hypothetical protein D3218_08985 [Aureimonas flava]|uniref:Uncharacterized protein n=1 Tax=Aureimonas flava TaxID=2320271 RepID=A0A3A1WTA1_9HYPH|nr:hypothetical protein [Aureimonas flava]RIY01474.1 hypothetical protein D3218_08985 [Aureimonas flava]
MKAVPLARAFRRPLPLLGGLLVAAGLALAEPALAYTYTNPTFGTSASFPARAFPNIAPPSPEGQVWRSDEGAELVVYAIEDPQWSNPAELVRWRKGLDRVTYQRTGRNWAVVSGFLSDGRIFYERYIFRGRLAHSVSVRYPEALRDPYDGLLKSITESLRGPSR